MNLTELRSYSQFQILSLIANPYLSRNLENSIIFEVCLYSCKTVKVSQNDQIQM